MILPKNMIIKNLIFLLKKIYKDPYALSLEESSLIELTNYHKHIENRKKHRTVTTKIDSKNYSFQSFEDDNYLNHLVVDGSFEIETVRLIKNLTNKKMVSVDIGANIGATAILLSDLTKHVYCFEPGNDTFLFLRDNTKMKNNITYFNFALGDCNKREFINTSPMSSGSYISKTNYTNFLERKEIYIRKYDDVMLSKKVDFIKIDVEGYEWKVLSKAKKSLKKYKPVVLFELNHWCLNAFHRMSLPDFFDKIFSIFPHLIAIHDSQTVVLNAKNPSNYYTLLNEHLVRFKYMNLLGFFDDHQIKSLKKVYKFSE